MRTPTVLAATAVAAALTLTACTAPGATGDVVSDGPITIGMVVPLTGYLAPLGLGDKLAAEQMVETINAAGGVDGRQITLIVKDDKTDVTQSVTEYNQLAANPDVSVMLSSSFVSASAATGASAEQAGIPTLALGPVSAFADGSNPWAFTVPATPEVYAQALVDYFADAGIDELAIAYVGTDVYGQSGNDATLAAAEKAGIEVVLDETYDQTATDFAPLLQKVENADPDGFLVWGAGAAPVIITKQLEGRGIPTFMTGAQASDLYLEPSGTAAEGIIASTSIAVAGPELPDSDLSTLITDFSDPYETANGTYPPQFAFDGAAGIQLAVAAIEAAGSTDRQAIRDAMEKLDLLTVCGHYTYSADNHSGLDSSAVAIMQVKDGAFTATDYALSRFATNLPK